MDKRYQVFVSSTFWDLEAERQEVMHALLELDCLPAGMELFPATNDTQWNLIKKVIDESDYYILIMGGRYGSVGPEGFSYTEMEYQYALSIGKPTIAFLHRNPGKIEADKTETSAEGKAKLAAFRGLAEKKLCKHWETPQELGSVVSRSLIQLTKSTPAVGWVRASELADTEATAELLKLRRQVEELQALLSSARKSAPKEAAGLADGEETHELSYNFRAKSPGMYAGGSTYNSSMLATWDEIFSYIAPTMMHEATELTLKTTLNSMISGKEYDRLEKIAKFKGLDLLNFAISEDDFQTVKIQLRALGLITQSSKNRSVKDSKSYWTLTPYGDEVMTRLRAIRKGPARDSVDAADGEVTLEAASDDI